MEQTLDEIATGEAKWLPYLKGFYSGEKGLNNLVKTVESQIDAMEAKSVNLEDLNVTVKIGRFGPYLEVKNGEEVITASIPADVTPADLDAQQVETLLKQKTEGPEKVGLHPETGEPIYLLIGTYGPYVQLGEATEENKKPKRTSLPKGMKPEDLTLDIAVGLLSLPRLLGPHPETGAKSKASLGRFGPYVVHDQGKEGKDYRSLKKEDDILTINLERALELLAQPKRSRGGGRKKTPLRELGVHPEDKEPINIYDGPYGAYIKYGKTNIKMPEGETTETVTLEQALEAIAAKGTTKKTSTRKKSTTAKKTTTAKKKTTTRKKTTKKTEE
jgi:DNA topoisomerase-1